MVKSRQALNFEETVREAQAGAPARPKLPYPKKKTWLPPTDHTLGITYTLLW